MSAARAQSVILGTRHRDIPHHHSAPPYIAEEPQVVAHFGEVRKKAHEVAGHGHARHGAPGAAGTVDQRALDPQGEITADGVDSVDAHEFRHEDPAGAVLGPCFPDEAVAQGRAAAMYAASYAWRLARARPAAESISVVDEELCSGCALCVPACPFEARALDAEAGVAQVAQDLCEGCGICAMVCPNGATQQRLFEPASVLAMVDAALE